MQEKRGKAWGPKVTNRISAGHSGILLRISGNHPFMNLSLRIRTDPYTIHGVPHRPADRRTESLAGAAANCKAYMPT